MSTATSAATTAAAATATAAFKKGTMTKKEHATLKKELFDQDVKSFHASLVKMSPQAFNAQKLDLNARLEQNIAAYAECKAILDNLMKAVKPLKTKMTKVRRVVKTLTAYKKTWTNERKLRKLHPKTPKTSRKVWGRSLFMGHYIKEHAKAKTEAGKIDRSATMTQASAAWAALSDDEKARWNAKAVDKNTEKETLRAAAALIAQVVDAPLGTMESDSDNDSVAAPLVAAPLEDDDSDSDSDDAAAAEEAADTQMAIANYDTDLSDDEA